MTNSQKHLKKTNYFIAFFCVLSIIGGCSKEKGNKNFIARVNNKYLTQKEFDSFASSEGEKNFYREEIIRNWIKQEVLYQEAEKKGVLKDDNFNDLLQNEKRELAVSFLIRKYYDSDKPKYEQKDIEDYYNKHQNEFQLFYDAYYINLIDFNNEDDAVKFRSLLMESDWNKALNVFKNDSSVLNVKTAVLLNESQIYPVALLRIVTDLNPMEVSIVLNYLPGHYAVVQELQSFTKGTILPFDVSKNEAEKRLVSQLKDDNLKSYIKDLYSNNNIEIKN